MTPYDEMIVRAREESEGLVLVERDGPHATVTMNEPERLNPLSAALTIGLLDSLEDLARDPQVRAVVLTGSDPAFSAGGDLRLMVEGARPMLAGEEGAADLWRWIRNAFGGIARTITRTDKAFIAAVNGPAAGVGLAFALACDVIVLSERAQIVPAFGKIGLIPEVGNSWHLTRHLGYQRAFGLFARGAPVGGAEAFELGIGNEVVAHEELMPAALKWAERVERLPRHVLAMMKPLLRQAADMTWEQAIAMEEFAEPVCFTTAAHVAGVDELLSRA